MSFMFPENYKKEIDKILTRYPIKSAATLPLLSLAQKINGYISKDIIKEVARILDLPESKVLASSTFYTMYNKKPVGKYHIQVCRNISCHLRGGEAILTFIKQELKINEGETTPDGMFTLNTVECLAACGTAPVMQINETYYENLTTEKVKKIFGALKNKEQQ